MKKPLLSIVVTTFDRKELLIETINSILEQKIEDIEIIIGNDNINRVVNEDFTGISDPRIRYINNLSNLGEWPNLQFLFRESRGLYFTSFSDDDLYAPNLFKHIISIIKEYNYPDCIYTSFSEDKPRFLLDSIVCSDVQEMSGSDFMDKYIKNEIRAMGNCGFFKYSKLEQLGGIVEWETRSYADVWMTFFMAGNNDRIIYINHPMIYFRVHQGSLSANVLNVNEWLKSQKELLQKMNRLIDESFSLKKEEYLYRLLSFWCLSSFYSRLIKLSTLNLSLVKEFFRLVSFYYPFIGKYKVRLLKDLGLKALLVYPLIIKTRFLGKLSNDT